MPTNLVPRLAACAILLCVPLGCSRQTEPPPDRQDTLQAPDGGAPAGPPTEVAVVATQHFITDMPEGYTPAHLRALLEKIKPDVLGVEAPVNVVDPWQFAPLELARVTRPWAEAHKVPAVPVGWHEPNYSAQLGQMFAAFAAGGRTLDYQAVENWFQAKSAKQTQTCQFTNSEAGHNLWREYHAALHRLYGRDTPWEEWNARILHQVLQVCHGQRGKRVAVVMGGAHGYYLLDRLAQQPDVRIVAVEKEFPLDETTVREQTTPRDYLFSLRLLNFPAVDPGQLPELESRLDHFKDVKDLENDYHLFRGKLRLHRGQFREALADFERVAALNEEAVSAFDGRSRLRETGRVYAAIANHRVGDSAPARKELGDLLNDPKVTDQTKQWARTVLATIPPPNTSGTR